MRLEGQRDGFTVCHVKNTGRCRELLVPGTEVWVQMAENPARKTPCDLICVKKGNRLINMDSQAPNCVAEEWLRKGNLFPKGTLIRREVRFGASRFDFYAEAGERRAFLEVKGVTLEDQGMTRFPDAPTQRGVRHVEELIRCMEEGYEAYLLFVIQMKGVLGWNPTMPPSGLRGGSAQGRCRGCKDPGGGLPGHPGGTAGRSGSAGAAGGEPLAAGINFLKKIGFSGELWYTVYNRKVKGGCTHAGEY